MMMMMMNDECLPFVNKCSEKSSRQGSGKIRFSIRVQTEKHPVYQRSSKQRRPAVHNMFTSHSTENANRLSYAKVSSLRENLQARSLTRAGSVNTQHKITIPAIPKEIVN